MPWNDHDGPVPKRTEEQLLALARAKAGAMRGRRQRQVGAGVASVLVLVLGAAAVLARDRNGAATRLETVSGEAGASTSLLTSTSLGSAPTSTSAVPSTSSTVPLPQRAPVSATSAPTPTTATTRPATARSSTTTTMLCRNSGDPACGPFRWDPPPGPNQPLTVRVSVTPTSPRVGETVTFHVTLDDPDGREIVDKSDYMVDYGDGTPFSPGSGYVVDCLAYGPWAPPPRQPVHEELAFGHSYQKSGTYTATLTFKSAGDCAYGPSDGTTKTTVTVAP